MANLITAYIGELITGGYVFHLGASTSSDTIFIATDNIITDKKNGLDSEYFLLFNTAIGDGKTNSNYIYTNSGLSTHTSAVGATHDLAIGGVTDWYLPSVDELTSVYTNLFLNNLGSFVEDIYWTSNEVVDLVTPPYSALTVSFTTGLLQDFIKDETHSVIGIRSHIIPYPILTNVNKGVFDENDTIYGNFITESLASGIGTFKIYSFSVLGIGSTYLPGVPVIIMGIGSFLIESNGDYSFTPIQGFWGPLPMITIWVDNSLGGATDATLTMEYRNVEFPPIIEDVYKTGYTNNTIIFNSSNFTEQFIDPDGLFMINIKILSLPIIGKLYYDGELVYLNQIIMTANIYLLTYVPVTNWIGSTSFKWNAFDGLNYANIYSKVIISIFPATIEGDFYEIIGDGSNITGYYMDYIKYPTDITLNSDCKLHKITHDKIVDIAVRILTGVTNPELYQLKQNENLISK